MLRTGLKPLYLKQNTKFTSYDHVIREKDIKKALPLCREKEAVWQKQKTRKEKGQQGDKQIEGQMVMANPNLS